MNPLDMRTVVFSYAVTNFICMFVIVLLWRRDRARFPGLGLWAADFAMQFAALVLISLRGAVPDILSMTVGNALAVGGAILLYIGLGRFMAAPAPRLRNWILLAVFVCLHGYFAVVSPDLAARNILISAAAVLVCLQCARLLLRRSPPEMRRVTRGAGYVFAAFVLINAVRLPFELAVPSAGDMFSANVYEILFLLSYQMAFIVLTFALVLMVSRRLAVELEHDITERRRAEEEKKKLAEILEERVKELDCLYAISIIKEIPGIALGERLERIVNVLPGAFRYPDLVCAKVMINGIEARTGNWRETDRMLAAAVTVGGEKAGEVEVGYLEEPAGAGEEQFMPQEKKLLDVVAGRLGRFFAGLRAEEALRLSEARHRSLFEICPAGICLLGLEGNLESVNPAGSAIFGYPAGELPGAGIWDILPKITRPDLDLLVENIKESGPRIFESEGRKQDGTAFPLAFSAVLHRITGRECMYLVFVDLTGQKQVAEAEHLQRLAKALLRFQEEERKHLARELHDHLGQDLATIRIGLALARKDHPELTPRLAEEIDESIRTADKVIADVRRISAGLRPESIDKIGLLPVLKEETRRLSSRSGVAIVLDTAGLEERLPPALEIAVYRIVQEALTNVIKHAGARHARITLRRGEAGIAVTIRDDGRGFRRELVRENGGLGLIGIRERVAAEGGSLRIESSPGEGTSLCVNIPLRPEKPARETPSNRETMGNRKL